MTYADAWHATLQRATKLDPDQIATTIRATADDGLRAASYDRAGGRTTFRPCDDPHCFDGDPQHFPHSHLYVSDPTGEAAINNRRTTDTPQLIDRCHRARINYCDAVTALNRKLRGGADANAWPDALTLAAQLHGPIAAADELGWDIGYWINQAATAVNTLTGLAHTAGLPRQPSRDERDWTSGLADDDCCVWHLEIHRRYRRRRLPTAKICSNCAQLERLGGKPPMWLLEAEVDRESKPKAWQQAISRWLDELGIPQHRRSAS